VYWNFVDVREGTFDSIIVISYVSWSSWSYSLPVCMRIGGEKNDEVEATRMRTAMESLLVTHTTSQPHSHTATQSTVHCGL
jgi:hypothetical protein